MQEGVLILITTMLLFRFLLYTEYTDGNKHTTTKRVAPFRWYIYISTNLEQRERIEGAIHRGTYGRSDHHLKKMEIDKMLRRLVEGRLAFVYSSAQVPASHDLMDGSPTRTLFFL